MARVVKARVFLICAASALAVISLGTVCWSQSQQPSPVAGTRELWVAFAEIWAILWSEAGVQARTVNVVLLVVFLAGIVSSLRARANLIIDHDFLLLVNSRLHAQPKKRVTLDEFESSVGIDALNGDSRIVNAWRDYWQAGASNVSDMTTLSDVRELEEESRGDVGAYLSTILVLIGLFGTLLGLSQAVIPLTQVVRGLGSQSTGLAEMRTGVEQVVTHLSSAFSCTIAGVMTTIVLSVCSFFWVSRRQTCFLAAMERFIITEISARSRPPVISESVRGLQNTIISSADAISRVSNETLKGLSGAVDKTHSCLSELTESFRAIATMHREQMADAVGTMASANRSLADSSDALTTLLERVEKTEKEVSASYRGILQETRGEVSQLYTKALQTLGNLGKEHSDFLVQAQEEYSRFYSATDQICNDLGQSAAALQEIALQLKDANHSLGAGERDLGALVRDLGAHTANTQVASVQVTESIQSLIAILLQASDHREREFVDVVVSHESSDGTETNEAEVGAAR